jgi:preprotein translocase subunit SecY
VPRIEELHKDGESGRKKINQWTRIITVPLALVQSVAYMYLLRQTALSGVTTGTVTTTLHEWVIAVMAMTAGAVLLMWIGELLTEQGIGNGISLLIYAGIISQLPATLGSLGSSLFNTSAGALNVFGWFSIPVNPVVFWVTLVVGLIALAATYILVKINEAQRVITINYAKRVAGNTTYGGVKSILPVKLIAAGVIPVIFAVAFISLPAFVGQVMKASANPHYEAIANTLITWFSAPTQQTYLNAGWPTLIYPTIYFILVIMFTYFYTGIVFNSQEISENLQKQGGFVEGIRPGLQTEKYLGTTVNRLVLFGSIALGLVSVLPFAIEYVLTQFGIQATNVAVGGTGLLIVVTVGLETIRQIDSRALMVTYDDYA